VSRILVKVIRKVTRQLGPPGDDDGAAANAFAALQAQEVDRRIRIPDPFKHARRSASLDGYSLHAGVRIHENDREELERLCRYAFRPPFALERLTLGEEGRLVYRMKRPRSGALYLVLTRGRAARQDRDAHPAAAEPRAPVSRAVRTELAAPSEGRARGKRRRVFARRARPGGWSNGDPARR
jgi:hypothetical protein